MENGNNHSDSESPRGEESLQGSDIPNESVPPQHYILIIGPGEDIIHRLVALSEQHNRVVQVESAFGSVSLASLRFANGGVTYRGNISIVLFNGFVYPRDTIRALPTEQLLYLMLAPTNTTPICGRVFGALVAATETQVAVVVMPPSLGIRRPAEIFGSSSARP